jgi:hypothetical protein
MSDDVKLLETWIIDCGSAYETAKIAARLKKHADHMKSEQLLKAYEIVRTEVMRLASISDQDFALYQVDEAIAQFGEE